MSFESRNGTCVLRAGPASAAMQLPSAAIDLLIRRASSSRVPSEPDLETRSEPARSTTLSRPRRATRTPPEAEPPFAALPSARSHCSTRIRSIACERDEHRFIAVETVARLVAETCTARITCCELSTTTSVRPST